MTGRKGDRVSPGMSSSGGPRPNWPIIALGVFGGLIALGLLALSLDHGAGTAPPPTPSPDVAAASATLVPTAIPTPSHLAASEVPSSIEALLAGLVIAPEHRVGYDRDLFPVWTDEDGDGCNTRYEVLIAQAVTPPTVSGSCHLTGGSWRSPYDGLVIHRADGVQIDHLVALAEAWYSGRTPGPRRSGSGSRTTSTSRGRSSRSRRISTRRRVRAIPPSGCPRPRPPCARTSMPGSRRRCVGA